MEAQIEQFARELRELIAKYGLTLAQVQQALAIINKSPTSNVPGQGKVNESL